MTHSPAGRIRLLATLLAWLLTSGGCASRQPPAHGTDADLREALGRGWVEATGDTMLLEKYHAYTRARDAGEPRGEAFVSMLQCIGFALEVRPIAGAQLIDILGAPDRWDVTPAGTGLLLYFYEGQGPEVALVGVGGGGMVTDLGYNARDAVDYSAFRAAKRAQRPRDAG